MKKFCRFILFIFLSAQSLAPAQETSMNGYSLSQFGDFTKDWELVTVRYRKDTGEMRFTYANKEAWNVLKNNKTDYPDGAVFAKIGIATLDDSAFPSSAVPAGARRVQFMVKNQKKHSETQGWGYALFDSEGKTFPGDLHSASLACAACHRAVPDRGYVFSQPMKIPVFSKHLDTWKERFTFKKVSRNNLPAKLKAEIPSRYSEISLLQGDIQKHPFAGTLDEIRPLLSKEVLRSDIPAALVSENEQIFSVVTPDSKKQCGENEVALKGMHTVPQNKNSLYRIEFCAEKNK